jgi:hypothetical protein
MEEPLKGFKEKNNIRWHKYIYIFGRLFLGLGMVIHACISSHSRSRNRQDQGLKQAQTKDS